MNLLEIVDATMLTSGDKYYVKRENKIVSRKIIFLDYDVIGSVVYARCQYENTSSDIYLYVHVNVYYRLITKEEYWEKVKEKYDAKCLDIVLKRLVDESFEW